LGIRPFKKEKQADVSEGRELLEKQGMEEGKKELD
jgi:hypothetical protein